MKHTTLSTIVLLLALGMSLKAESQTLEFAITIPTDTSGHTGTPNSISLAPDGNIVVAGYHEKGMYFAKFDPSGAMLWRYIVPVVPYSTNVKVKIDREGNIYLYGSTDKSFDADPSSAIAIIEGYLNGSAYVIKYDHTGKYLWGKARKGNDNQAKAITFDNEGSCYVTGSIGNYVPYFEKYDRNGEYVWSFEYKEYCAIGDVATDSLNNIIIAGETLYRSTIDVDNGPGTVLIGNSTSNRAFIARYDGNGNYLSSIDIGGLTEGSSITPISLAVDPSNNVIVSGNTYGDSIDVDPSANDYFLCKNGRMFISKYSPDLTFLLAFQLRDNDSVTHLSLDDKGNIYSTGRIGSDSIDIDPGNGTVLFYSNNLARRGYADIFFGAYTPEGKYRWGYVCNSPGPDWAYGSVPDNKGNLYVAGNIYGDTIDFDPSPATAFLSSEKSTSNPKQNISSPFIAKYSVLTNAVKNITDISSNQLSAQFVNDKLHIGFASYSHDDVVINVYDALGKNVLSDMYHPTSLGTQDVALPFANQATGLYVCELKIGNIRKVAKLMVVK